MDADITCAVALWKTILIVTVFNLSNDAKVDPAVIGRFAIDVVDYAIRHFSSHIENSKPMD